ncbi:MAG TPA: hypothetical protein VN633_19880 [Bryobacteraceae bacterium]|nr:hypothetical protein [Bryobacteraceae bacterium]
MPAPYFTSKSLRPLNFHDLQRRLISFVVTKIRNGEFTERGLARILGVSQPHLHNVLKGARPLKPEFADCLLEHFEIGILDLMESQDRVYGAPRKTAGRSEMPHVPRPGRLTGS